MARPFRPLDADHNGRLVVEQLPGADCVGVFYIPPPAQLRLARIDPARNPPPRAKLLELDTESGRVTIFPINTFGERPDFLKPKYEKVIRITLTGAKRVVSASHDGTASTPFVRSITLGPTQPIEHPIDDADISDSPVSEDAIVDILENLPPAFTKDYDYGLGLAKPYRFIIEAVESLSDCTEIVISKGHETKIANGSAIFYISSSDFDEIRRSLNSITSISRDASTSVKCAETHNFFASKVGRSAIPTKVGRHPLRQLFTASLETRGEGLSSDEQEEVLSALEKNVQAISEARPTRLVRLQSELELVNLRGLLGHFKNMMSAKHSEANWQDFLDRNPFILALAFGYPVALVQGQAFVGGRTLSGKGTRIADFLVKNSMTNNAAIVEIKTPRTRLLNRAPYRDGVFRPSAELSGAINQVLDQKHKFDREIATVKMNSGMDNIETYSVHGCLIVGTMPDDEARRRSFEFFRGNSKSVQIVTFDELYEKLTNLHEFLSTTEMEEIVDTQVVDVPF